MNEVRGEEDSKGSLPGQEAWRLEALAAIALSMFWLVFALTARC